jgi:lysophospholipase L1-like esterase
MSPDWLLTAVLATQGAPATTQELRFLALGDSYTIGEGVAALQRWPQQLANRLRLEGIALGDPRIVATTGWTTDELDGAMDAAAFEPPYDFVTLSIGVNNQYRGRSADEYRDQFRALLARAIALAGGRHDRVVVVSIPDWGVTKFGRGSGRDVAKIASELDAYNAINRDEARRAGAAWADVSAISRTSADAPDQLADDGLHPSGKQYARWLETILPAARAALASRPTTR